MILEDSVFQSQQSGGGAACRICVTQPRRIAALSLADRVHDELYASLGVSTQLASIISTESTKSIDATDKDKDKDKDWDHVRLDKVAFESAVLRLQWLDNELLPPPEKGQQDSPDSVVATPSLLFAGSQCPSIGAGLVGYSVRLESRVSDNTRLLYCTTGVLLRKLQSDDYLQSLSHIVLDEVHERGVSVCCCSC
jgi:hypothetical protein